MPPLPSCSWVSFWQPHRSWTTPIESLRCRRSGPPSTFVDHDGGHNLSKSLNCSHASYKDSSSLWVDDVIWFLRLVVLLDGKNLARKTFVSSSHIVIDSRGYECSHVLTLSLSENGNRHMWMASVRPRWSSRHTPLKTPRGVSLDPPSTSHRIGTAGPLIWAPAGVQNYWLQLVVLWCLGLTMSTQVDIIPKSPPRNFFSSWHWRFS